MKKRIMKKLREKNTEETKSNEKEVGAISGLNFTVDLFGPTSITRELKTTANTENKRPKTKQIEKKQESYQISKVFFLTLVYSVKSTQCRLCSSWIIQKENRSYSRI